AEAAGQDPDRLQRQRRSARHAPRRDHRFDRLALIVGAVHRQRLRPLHRPDRRQRKRHPAARAAGHRSERQGAGRAGTVAGDIARLTAGPPGIPQPQLDALRAAYKAALTDPELLEKAKKLGLPIEPLYGDDVLKKVKEALNQSPETVAILKAALEQ